MLKVPSDPAQFCGYLHQLGLLLQLVSFQKVLIASRLLVLAG
ncbi:MULTISPECIES: hypothetical protein [unclassified Synechococcus]|jgi:hypothetical protein|nr:MULTISPECIES: hypothetical protein [unclassified Synechococcus]MEA5424914.1 hypothetical protein [Synechococcus sp. CCY9202]